MADTLRLDILPRAKDLLDVVPVLGILSIEDLIAAAHVRSRQLILRALVLLEFKNVPVRGEGG